MMCALINQWWGPIAAGWLPTVTKLGFCWSVWLFSVCTLLVTTDRCSQQANSTRELCRWESYTSRRHNLNCPRTYLTSYLPRLFPSAPPAASCSSVFLAMTFVARR
jgi:hypothetical protein